jgi:hypothetical protein
MKIRVLQALNKWEKRRFDYGNADCCQFAGFIVKELTGKDYLTDFNYTCEDEAEKIIKSNGDLIKTASTVLGEPTKDELADGSPVLVDLPTGQTMGIKLDNYVVCLVKNGFIKIPEEFIVAGWKLCLV